MSESTRHQPYKYSLVTSARSDLGNYSICNDQIGFWITPPQEAITIEYIRTHLIFEFGPDVPVDQRILSRIGICDVFPYRQSPREPSYFNLLDINQVADANRRVELDINLTSLLKKDNVNFRTDDIYPASTEAGYTFIYVKLGEERVAEPYGFGIIKLWKTDALFTTKGIV